MNGCKDVSLNFDYLGYFSTDCSLVGNSHNSLSTTYYVNVSDLNFDVIADNNGRLRVCKYDLNKKLVSFSNYGTGTFPVGSNTLKLDPNYLYRFSYSQGTFSNIKGYNCNVSIGSMSNELAFGKLTFLEQINTITPFLIILIAFALGFLLLKKMINRGNKGHA